MSNLNHPLKTAYLASKEAAEQANSNPLPMKVNLPNLLVQSNRMHKPTVAPFKRCNFKNSDVESFERKFMRNYNRPH